MKTPEDKSMDLDNAFLLREAAKAHDMGYSDHLANGGKGDPAEERWIEALNAGADAIVDNSRLTDTIRSLTDQLNASHDETAKAMRERDAAMRHLHGDCDICKWYETENCAYCIHDPDAWNTSEDNWEWVGVCPENTEVQPND